jgi:triacylglycerol lipase
MLRRALALSVACACGGRGAEQHADTTTESTGAPGSTSDGSSSETGIDATGSAEGSGEVGSSTGAPRLGPPYPVVLAHGFFGFETFAGVDFVTYFFGVRDHLVAGGEPWVFTPAVDPFDDSTDRGLQLVAEVEAILAETGHAKVNLVGHSQGGLDARVVASLRPDLVASVTTFATPHQGTPIADIALGVLDDPEAQDLADELVQLIGAPLWDELGESTSVIESLQQLSSAGIAVFNATYPDAPDVIYLSIGGRSDYHAGGGECEAAATPPWIAEFSATLDPVDSGLWIAESILDGPNGFDPAPNDGLVRVADAKWGSFLGCVPADHLDEMGQLVGDSPGLGNDWQHLAFYGALVQHLRELGL